MSPRPRNERVDSAVSEAHGTSQPLGALYEDLRTLAQAYMSGQRLDHTLQPTALVHEAYLKLVTSDVASGLSRQHLYCVAARAMRCVLIDHARSSRAAKRTSPGKRVPLDAVIAAYEQQSNDLVELESALIKLESVDLELARLVELRFFGGLTIDATAAAMGMSPRTARREWQIAKAWLSRQIRKGEHDGGNELAENQGAARGRS